MKAKDYQITFSVDRTPHEVFDCINNVSKWWTENLEGGTQRLNDEFTVRFGDVHYSKQVLVEFVPDKKVVWLVTDSKLNFIRDQQEWTNTKISFEISIDKGRTKIDFRHLGLVPEVECFDACSNAWSEYIQQSLLRLIETGVGNPALKEAKTKSKKSTANL